jgi:CRAL/TRIO domain
LLRSCFSKQADKSEESFETTGATMTAVSLTDEEVEICSKWERLIDRDVNVQTMAVRGHDKKKRAIVVKACRSIPWDTDDTEAGLGFKMTQIYFAERAIAATEVMTLGRDDYLAAMFDFGAYESTNSPPARVMIATVKELQANYPERLGNAVVVGAPFWMQAVMKMLYPFMAEATRSKLHVLGSSPLGSLWATSKSPTADLIREETIGAIVDGEQAMAFMLAEAKLTSEINVQRQLHDVPFFQLYDAN